MHQKVLSMILVLVMLLGLLSMSAFTMADTQASADTAGGSYEYNIMFLDCGRKYYSVDSIKKIIDNASAAGFNYIQLAVGNDGLRFLLDDMSLTVGDQTYESDAVKKAIHKGNTDYNAIFSKEGNEAEDSKELRPYNPTTNELAQSEMDTIIAYAASKGMGVIPCVNTPGHMDAILSAANALTGKVCSYGGSARTIDVTNTTAVAFTKALLQKYINYFADKGCQLFNMGADEYANDKYTGGSMGFGNLQSTGKYNYYVTYVNQVAKMIENAGMRPMAFNDGIYYNNDKSSGTFDTNILICYWSSGWEGGYTPRSASNLVSDGFQLINTHGDYYWVLGKNAKCSAETASNFNTTAFYGSTVNNPAGSMFCIWADYPGAETEASVITKTAATIAAFGNKLTKVPFAIRNTADETSANMTVGAQMKLSVNAEATWSVTSGADVVTIAAQTRSTDIKGTSVTIEALGAGSATITATNAIGNTATFDVTVNEPDTETITVAVGGTKTIKVDGNYAGTYTTENPAIATVETTPTAASEKKLEAVTSIVSGEQYLIFNNRQEALLTSTASNDWRSEYYGLLLNGAASVDNTTDLWTISGSNGSYTVKNNAGNYLTIGENTASVESNSAALTLTYNSDGYWNISQNSYYLNHLGTSTTAGGYQTKNSTTAATDEGSRWTIYKITGGDASTDITFTGESEGTTSVTIGGVKYNIKVVSQALADVTPLTLEYWITNARPTDSNESSELAIHATDNNVATEAGVSTADLLPKTVTKDKRTQEYWQTKLLDTEKKNTSTSGTELQTTVNGDDETLNGTSFTKVRYWNNKWQVFTTTWVDVDRTQVSVSYTNDNTNVTYTGDKNQLVAYYMEIVDIKNSNGTTNLHINAADWGTKGDGTGNWGYTPESDRCSVSIQLVYPDGTVNPTDTTADALKSKTIVYGYWSEGRGLGTMIFDGQGAYQIYKVTAETGTMSSTAASDNTVTVTSFTWAKNEETVWQGDATESVSIGNPAKNPSYDEPYDNLAWNTSTNNKNNAILIRVYVKDVPKADSLTVNYYIDHGSAAAEKFYDYTIGVAENTKFAEGFARVVDATAAGGAKLVNNTVVDYEGNTRTVQSDLSRMTEIGSQYRYSNYQFTKAERSDDGKTVNLYYKFSWNKAFVVDFGLPLVIRPQDVNANLGNEGVSLTKAEITQQTTYADISVDTNKNITYKLNKTIDGEDNFSVHYEGNIPKDNGTQTGAVDYSIQVIPATNVYYEDSFATFTNRDDTTDVGKGTVNNGYWVTDGTTNSDAKQALEELGAQTKNVYGYDPAYANCSKFSMGSATKVTVDANTSKDGQSPTATFTFKGTGFDVISLTGNQSGTVMYTVTNKGTNEKFSNLVNTYYGYKYENGEWTTTTAADPNTLYQIPVIREVGLPYGEYEVTISVLYGKYFNSTANDCYSFWLDAIRVYDPMGKDNETYKQDGEGYPQYIKLRDELVSKSATVAGEKNLLFIDGGSTADIATYANYGPNNEVYLAKGQAISFGIPSNSNIESIQIGAKAPDGTSAKMAVNEGSQEIKTATEMYYKITASDGKFTIANSGDGILALTNLKITFETKPDAQVTLSPLTDTEQSNAVALVRALFAAPATEPFQPERFEASWSRNVRKGETATLTVKASENVEAITVNGETINSYVEHTERTGWGWWAKTVTYREFTYKTTADVTTDYTVCAVNGEGVSSDPITATLTVRTSVRDWLHGIIGKWF